MNKRTVQFAKLSLLSLALIGCITESENDGFAYPEDLTIRADFVYDAEVEKLSVDLLHSHADSNQPYRFVPKDEPTFVTWNGADSDLTGDGTGRLSTTLDLEGNLFGELLTSVDLFSSIIDTVSLLQISDLPTLLDGSYQDTEVMKIIWNPSENSLINSDYLENNTVDVSLRGLRCENNQTVFSIGIVMEPAESVYLSENTISTVVTYQSVLDLLVEANTTVDEQCQLDLSIASTQTLQVSQIDSFDLEFENPRELNPVSYCIDDRFANTINDESTFTFYSPVVTISLNQ